MVATLMMPVKTVQSPLRLYTVYVSIEYSAFGVFTDACRMVAKDSAAAIG